MNTDILIGTLIKRRKGLKLMQQNVAELTGISRRTITSLDTGNVEISFFRIIKIAFALNLQITFRSDSFWPVESELSNQFK
ncbi:helix-turn-helix domain-containing protein [Undibacterium umbellatum]|uniref:helix-turn-helix domain-containing protein n=1 Tax=Undibacterium umbellatum TaxID=2762300 RepID=UPI003BB7E8F6